MRLATRAPTAPNSGCGKAIDLAIVKNDRALSDRAVKRAFDIVVATVGLILFSPIFALVSIANKIEACGPVFCRQMAHGHNNENITLLKFRTTVLRRQKKSTRLDAVLRRTGIEGLPLLINVLRGEMSIVGPSPYLAVPYFAEQISLNPQRERMKPGITGWAQVNGCRGESDKIIGQRIEFDQYYIENWSFLFDIKIILMTLFSKDVYLS